MDIERLTYIYIISVSVLSIIIFPVILEPLDNDVFYHLTIARDMIEKKTPVLYHVDWYFAPQGVLHWYPPLFHWLLVIFSLGGLINLEYIAIFFQLIFYPLALLSAYHLVSYMENQKIGFITTLLLSTYFPFFARTHLAIPEALQHILIPVAFLMYLKGNEKLSILTLIALALSHRYDALLVFFAIIFHWALYKRKLYDIRNTVILFIPFLLLQVYYIQATPNSALSRLTMQGHTEYRFISGIVCTFILGILFVWSILTIERNSNRNCIIVWFLFTIPIFVFSMASRFPAYAAMPMSILVAIMIDREIKKYQRYSVNLPIIAVLLLANIYISYEFYAHACDFMKPGVDKQEEEALLWISKNIPEDEIILVRRSFYEGCRITYYTHHKTTQSPEYSKYLYISPHNNPPQNGWKIIKESGPYKVYRKNNNSIGL